MEVKNKIALILIVMVFAAIAEVSVTAYLVDKLGVFKLVGVYIITTAIGFLFIWISHSRKKEMLEVMKNTDMESFPADAKEREIDPRVLHFGKIGISIGFFVWVVILIIIPGIVTDALGLVILFFMVNK